MRTYNYIILVTLSLVSPSYGIQGLKLNQLVPQELRSGPEGGNTCVLSGRREDLLNLLRSFNVFIHCFMYLRIRKTDYQSILIKLTLIIAL